MSDSDVGFVDRLIHGSESAVLSVECPKLMMDTQHSKLRINTLSVKCGVLSICHKSGSRLKHFVNQLLLFYLYCSI